MADLHACTCSNGPHTDTPTMQQAGLIVDGQFIPIDIARQHMPFAAPPDTTVRAVWYIDWDDQ